MLVAIDAVTFAVRTNAARCLSSRPAYRRPKSYGRSPCSARKIATAGAWVLRSFRNSPGEPAAPLQERFWQKHMDPLVTVDQLRHTQVAGERAQHVSLVASEIGARADVFDHFSDGLLGRVIEILVKAN
jgi:hypothetical protein